MACLLSRSGGNPGIVSGAGAYRAAGSAGASSGGGRRRVLAPLASDVRGRRARPAPVARSVSAAEDGARRAPVRRSGACAPAPVWPRLPRGGCCSTGRRWAARSRGWWGSTARSVPSVARRRCSRTRRQGWGRCSGRGVGSDRSTCRPGTLLDRSSSVELVLACAGRFRIPEPIRLAHHATTALRRAHDTDVLPVAVRDYPWFVRKTHSGLRND